MPDVVSLLERAAAQPTRAPDVDGPRRRRRHRQLLIAGVLVVLAAVGAGTVVARRPDHDRVRVVGPPARPAPTRVTSAGASIDVEPGWYATPEPLAWWLSSPKELFSIATVQLPPAPHRAANEAACPSEIPAVAVDNLPPDGAYLWVGEWHQGGTGYGTETRSPSSVDVKLDALCPLPNGLKAYGASLHDGAHDYIFSIVLGPEAPAERRAEIFRMLDSLQFATP